MMDAPSRADPQQVILASRNAHKITEVRRILDKAGFKWKVVGLDSLEDPPADVPETGETFAANAIIKAVAVSSATGMIAIADDSGICVDALNGMPGVRSARWAGQHGDDQANLDLVLAQITDVPDERRGAQFRCALAWVEPGQEPLVVEGVVEGTLIREPRGPNGFGYDPIFVPDGLDETTAQMSAERKDALSHRARALAALIVALSPR